jgi:rRNA maturation endonuclease Nob1
MTLSEYELRQLLYFYYNDLQPFTADDVLRKAKMNLNRNTTKEEIEKLLNIMEVNKAIIRNDGGIRLSKKLVRHKCIKCMLVFYLGEANQCPNCGGNLQSHE